MRADRAAADATVLLDNLDAQSRGISRLRRGAEPLFEQVSFTVFRGDKVGITGANGAGKSSLFAAIRGELAPDRGDIDLPATLKIAHVEQEIAASATPRDRIRAGRRFGTAQRTAPRSRSAERRDRDLALAELYATLEAIDGYRARARAAAIMHGLGFKAADHERKVAEFSGGWRVRLAMARALSSRADLLLLDEPTNHLDLDAIVWLEDWLTALPGHAADDFPRSRIPRCRHRPGAAYRESRHPRLLRQLLAVRTEARAEELALQSTLHARQVRRIAEITSFVNRFRARPPSRARRRAA